MLTALLVLSGAIAAGGQTNLVSTNAGSTVNASLIPFGWLDKAKGYEQALALQRQSGADIFIYFSSQKDDERGLCAWFESKGLENNQVKKYLKNYIRVKVPLPSNPDCQKLAEQFEVRRCPAIFIVQPGGLRQFCKVFTWENNRPKLNEPDALIETFRVRSGEWYLDK